MKTLSDQSQKRAANRYAILRTLHFEGRQQRAALSRMLRIRKSSVTSITAELVAQGLIVEDDPHSLRTTLSLNAKRACVVVGRLGVDEIETARVMLNGDVESAKRWHFQTGAAADEILDLLGNSMAQLVRAPGKRVLGAGFADLGIVDPVTGVTRLTTSLPRWHDVPVRSEMERRLEVGVHVDNDVRSQLWSAAWFERHLNECRTMLYVGVLEGVAGALIMNGRMVLGRNFCAGEIGHIRVGNEGRPCGCGKTDCLETYCSLGAITKVVQSIRPRFEPDADGTALAVLARNDPVVMDLLSAVVARIASVVAPILAALDPDALVFGSPSSAFAELVGSMLHQHLQRDLAGLEAAGVRLIITGADHHSTLRGIGGLVIDHCFQRGTPVLTPAGETAAAKRAGDGSGEDQEG